MNPKKELLWGLWVAAHFGGLVVLRPVVADGLRCG